jgi:hypothetical protein
VRPVLALILLLVLAGCQSGPAGSGPARDPAYGDRRGGMCSPYASGCW